MKLTIDNYDGNGAVDYTSSIVAGRPFRILRRLNQPVTCECTLLPAPGLATPARNARITVADDAGLLLFTGYIAAEPALELAGEATTGAVSPLFVTALGDEMLLDRQPIPPTGLVVGATAGSAAQAMLLRSEIQGITTALSLATMDVSDFQILSSRTWSENVAALAAASRNAYLLQNSALSLNPIGTVTHSLSESAGTLSLSDLQISTAKALANDITVCGEDEPAAYVTEFFQGDGTTVLFELACEPWKLPASKSKTFTDNFPGSLLNMQSWILNDPGSAVAITANGLTCAGGNGILGNTVVSAFSTVEMGGGLLLETNAVQFGQQTTGVLNGLYFGGETSLPGCLAGFQIGQSGGAPTIAPILNGVVAGSTFTAVAAHIYTLRLRFYSNEVQRILQAYYITGAVSGFERFGADLLPAAGTFVFEVQDTTNGVAGTPVILYAGPCGSSPAPWCVYAPLNASFLDCSIGSVTVQRLPPNWVVSTPPNGTAVIRRIGTTAQGADCTVESTGKLRFYPASTPQAGELIAISYRTSRRSVARFSSATSITAESLGGKLPGTAAWIGTVTNPAPRSSVDCENAAQAILALSTSRAAAWAGQYTAWNPEQQGGAPGSVASDIWPGDVLAIASTSSGITANLVVRTVEIDLTTSVPALAKYTISFANDWADSLSIETSATVPADAWLPLQPETTTPLANLDSLTITSVTGSQIQISAGVTPPTGGGFEVRRLDYSFTPGAGPDLVLRSPVPNFTIPRQAAIERYYIRMYDASTPPNYSRFSSAVFVNLPLTT
ncbi:MAG: hypothetical protein WB622_07730 [Acidobacteriaceae bacterium]